MFEIPQILKYLSFISYLGFIISSISGFVVVVADFNLCQFIISLVVITNISIIMFYEITNQIEDYIQNLNYFRAYVQLIISLLILGLSPVGVGFGIYGIILGLINLFIGILCLEPSINTQNIRESTIETP
jgi:hypothetical protein